MTQNNHTIHKRFRGFLPVIIDIETSGINPETNALLEIAAITIHIDANGIFAPKECLFEHILPFEGAVLDEKSLEFNKIDPFQPLRFAIDEKIALTNIFAKVTAAIKQSNCSRAVLVGHNAWFDLLFLKAAAKRCHLDFPFHAFTCFDTATLAAVFYQQTVLSKAVQAAGIPFNLNEAHSAIYDAEKTAELFCKILNTFQELNCFKNSL